MKQKQVWVVALIALSAACCFSSKEGNVDRSVVGSSAARSGSAQAGENRIDAKRGAKPQPAASPKSDTHAKPNVIVVLLDTLRPDYLGFLGNETETAPFMAALSKGSTVFENALSTSSWTAPSVSSLFTGLYPPQHTVVQGFRAHRGMIEELKDEGHAEMALNRMPVNVTTLSEMFKKTGYKTFGLTSNINIGKEIGFSRGFDRFEQIVRAPAETLFSRVIAWHEDIVGTAPFFLYLHFNDVHVPYHAREPYFQPAKSRKDDAAARYRSEIGYVDAHLRKIWQLPGMSKNTVMVIVSDHGEEFWEHGGTEHGPTLYGELNRILMMVHGPSSGITGKRVTHNVSLIDILPTLASLIGVKLDAPREGISLLPLLRNSDDTEGRQLTEILRDRCLFGHRMYSSRRDLAVWSITCGSWKLIDWWGDRRKLFDHRTDREEYHDVFSKRSRIADELYHRISDFKARMKTKAPASAKREVELNTTLLAKLRSLGYVE